VSGQKHHSRNSPGRKHRSWHSPTGAGRRRWTMRWKAPLNAFQTAFEGRLDPVIH
jgi:hypothetical protein